MVHSKTETIDHLNLGEHIVAVADYADIIEYVDDIGYVYISCIGCVYFSLGCDRCVEASLLLTEEVWKEQRHHLPRLSSDQEVWEDLGGWEEGLNVLDVYFPCLIFFLFFSHE
uniref:Uncharacterized protein n=1 Tax=Cacopsylla melanoneura TaxID=428564 RepID=A0A8D8TLN4_9HEMI